MPGKQNVSLSVVLICAFDLRNLIPSHGSNYPDVSDPHLSEASSARFKRCFKFNMSNSSRVLLSHSFLIKQSLPRLPPAPVAVYLHPVASDRNHSCGDLPSAPENIWLVTKFQHLSNLTLLDLRATSLN